MHLVSFKDFLKLLNFKEVPYKTEHFTQLYNIIYIKELSFKILEGFMSEEIAKQQAEIKKKS